ncbi:MAG TPA: O-antigen ligase family protein, partial [Herpetosiphonaceae bacterium]
RVERLLRLDEGTGAARLEIWAAAARALRGSPLLGLGLDQFAHAAPQLRFLTISHPHNLVLDAWTQLGLAGLLALAGWTLWAAWRLWRARANPLALAALAALVALSVHGMLDQTMLGGDLIYCWWLLWMLAGSLRPGEGGSV